MMKLAKAMHDPTRISHFMWLLSRVAVVLSVVLASCVAGEAVAVAEPLRVDDSNAGGVGRGFSYDVQPLDLQKVTVRGATGAFVVRATLDTTSLGGYQGLVDALHQGFTFSTLGAGVPVPQSIHFPPCVSVINCQGPASESASFLRKGATNRFAVVITGYEPFSGPFLTVGVLTTLSLEGVDFVGVSVHCKVSGRKQQNVTCRK